MIEQVAIALKNQNYPTAAKLIKQLLKESPEDPWVLFYLGRLYEVTKKYKEAEKIYRQLLRNTATVKIVTVARQGLQRLQNIQNHQREQAVSQSKTGEENSQTGVLVLEPLEKEAKTTAAQQLAKIMQVDPYSARLILPSRGWKLYRSGAIGELKFYGEQLRNAKIPCFWAKIVDIQKIQVFQVKYFDEIFDEIKQSATVICNNSENVRGSLSFEWKEVKQRVQGMLPIFEEVVERDAKGKSVRKVKILDYLHFCDLHLPSRNCILRLYDNGYDYQHGVEISYTSAQNTVRLNWNNLLKTLDKNFTDIPLWSDFKPFAETALDQIEVLNKIESHINLLRREASNWDPLFHLYSSLVFINNLN
ncbi:MAG: tetratricopeptide repeat protein [Cyanobacteria bacterium P01_A01_bin.84]